MIFEKISWTLYISYICTYMCVVFKNYLFIHFVFQYQSPLFSQYPLIQILPHSSLHFFEKRECHSEYCPPPPNPPSPNPPPPGTSYYRRLPKSNTILTQKAIWKYQHLLSLDILREKAMKSLLPIFLSVCLESVYIAVILPTFIHF